MIPGSWDWQQGGKAQKEGKGRGVEELEEQESCQPGGEGLEAALGLDHIVRGYCQDLVWFILSGDTVRIWSG